MIAIIDFYTDEPAGLGVPPYFGVYPRYIAGSIMAENSSEEIKYLTVDDIRRWKKGMNKRKSKKTDISTYNLSVNSDDVDEILSSAKKVIFILGVHVPGKYLSARPGTIREIIDMRNAIRGEIVITGPGVLGTQVEGGKRGLVPEGTSVDASLYNMSYDDIAKCAVKGADIVNQVNDPRIMEIETGRGCDIGKCSFCLEPIKCKLQFRDKKDVLAEVKALYDNGARMFRIGKQNCFYTVPYAVELLKDIRKECPDIEVLHIDNVNPMKVVMDDKENDRKITRAIVKYCTSGNIAAFGVESFDAVVVKENYLNCKPEVAYSAIKIINEEGGEFGDNGTPKFLPGINLIFGLKGETKKTHEENMKWLQKIYDEGLMLRRINVRQVALFEGTPLYEEKSSMVRKNKKYYWKWRDEIRQKIDWPMLKRVFPEGTVLKKCYAEVHDGNNTFLRQFGTYPIIVGVKEKLELKKFYDVRITKHMLRSVTGEVV